MSQSFVSPVASPMMYATHLDSKISLSLARVLIDTLRELSPRMRERVDERIAEEVKALREEADVHFDVLSDAAATVIENSFEQTPVHMAHAVPHAAASDLHHMPIATQSAAPRREPVTEALV